MGTRPTGGSGAQTVVTLIRYGYELQSASRHSDDDGKAGSETIANARTDTWQKRRDPSRRRPWPNAWRK
jgi:hypothetical protein